MKKLLRLLTLVGAVALLLPQDAWPQKPGAMRRIGVLLPGMPPAPGVQKLPPIDLFRVFPETLARHGYVDGKNLSIEVRIGEYEHLPALAKELEQRRVELIWVVGTRAGRIVQGQVKRTPLGIVVPQSLLLRADRVIE